MKKQREQTEDAQKYPGNKNSGANTSNSTSNVNNFNNNNNKNSNRAERKPKTIYPPCETCGKTNHFKEKCYFGANAANRPPPRHRRPERQNQDPGRANQSDYNDVPQAAAQKYKLKMPRFHSGAAIDRPETTHLTLPPIPEIVWQQPQETYVTNILKTLTNETHKNTQMPESKQTSEVESQTSPMKETSSQVSVSSTEPLPGNQTRNTLVESLNDSNKPQPEIQQHERNIIANDNGDDSISPPKTTTSQIEDQLVRADTTNELYIPLPLQLS